MNANAQLTPFPGGSHADCLHRMVELVDADRYSLDKMSACFCKSDAARVPLEQQDAKDFFQRLDARAHARRADAKRIGGVTEVQILGDC